MNKFLFLICLLPVLSFSQENNSRYTFDINNFYGKILNHTEEISQFTDHSPEGFLISINRKTYGEKSWQSRYNYPDYGLSFEYQNMKNEELGYFYGLYGHYNFYFFKRNLMLRIAQGVAYNTNPYDVNTNPENMAYGTHWMPATYFMLNYKKERIWNGLGLQAGVTFFHHSNANLRSPNKGTNTVALNIGAVYNFDSKESLNYIPNKDSIKFTEPIRYNLAFRTGFNESDLVGSGQYPFYVFSAYADKRLNRKSAIHIGAEFFMMKYLKGSVWQLSHAPGSTISPDTDYRKAGVFIGHELFVNKLSLETQFGYYAYAPLDYLPPIYQRLGLKYYLMDEIFIGVALKTHAAKAEALEFGIGVRL